MPLVWGARLEVSQGPRALAGGFGCVLAADVCYFAGEANARLLAASVRSLLAPGGWALLANHHSWFTLALQDALAEGAAMSGLAYSVLPEIDGAHLCELRRHISQRDNSPGDKAGARERRQNGDIQADQRGNRTPGLTV